MAMQLPSLPGLNEHDLKAIEAVSQASSDRYAHTIRVLIKEVRRLQELNDHLKEELHQALNTRKMPYKK